MHETAPGKTFVTLLKYIFIVLNGSSWRSSSNHEIFVSQWNEYLRFVFVTYQMQTSRILSQSIIFIFLYYYNIYFTQNH